VGGTFHQRRADEYRRPGKRLVLDAACLARLAAQPPAALPASARSPHTTDSGQTEQPAQLDQYEMWLGGTAHQPYRFDGHAIGDRILLELVPEPYNPADTTAVACDYDGHRVGYLFSNVAADWHDVVRAAKAAGVAVLLPAQLHADDFHDRPDGLIPRVLIPNWAHRLALFAKFGLADLLDELLARLDAENPELVRELLEASWEAEYRPEVISAVSKYADAYHEFSWPTSPAGGPARRALPACWEVYLRALLGQEREAARTRRQEERRQRAAEREAARAAAAAARAETERARAERDALIIELTQQGVSARDIAAEVGVSAGQVAKVRGAYRAAHPEMTFPVITPAPVAADATVDLSIFGGAKVNLDQARERLDRGTRALTLQQAGASRAKIGADLGVSVETVKGLLRDARFYAQPTSASERLERAQGARRAHEAGTGKARYEKECGLSKGKAEESWRDATSLTLLAAWPDLASD